LVDAKAFGLNRDELAVCLQRENITTKKYFYPPLHMQNCYPELRADDKAFPNTSAIANNVLCLPMFSELTSEQVNGVVEAITRIQEHVKEIKVVLRR